VGAIRETGALAIVRVRAQRDLLRVVEALRGGGLTCVEITMNTPGVLETIREAASSFPDLTLGAGTVVGATDAKNAISAGAQFLVTPILAPEVIRAAAARSCPVICGAMTPTEIYSAYTLGADLVKVFPADVLGAAFLRAMRGPFPEIPLAPTGGINSETAPAYIQAGAAAVCAGGWLVNDHAIVSQEYEEITRRARALCLAVEEARKAGVR